MMLGGGGGGSESIPLSNAGSLQRLMDPGVHAQSVNLKPWFNDLFNYSSIEFPDEFDKV